MLYHEPVSGPITRQEYADVSRNPVRVKRSQKSPFACMVLVVVFAVTAPSARARSEPETLLLGI